MGLKITIKKIIRACIPCGLVELRRRRLFEASLENMSQELLYTKLYKFVLDPVIFKKIFLKKEQNGKQYFNFNGALLPDVSSDIRKMWCLMYTFNDTFMFSCLFDDNYDKSLVKMLDLYMPEGPYGYTDGPFDVSVHKNDIVIDAGAWIGDFSAYSASKGAIVYAFEPVQKTFILLEQTVELNKGKEGKIYPVKKGLSDKNTELNIFIDDINDGASTLLPRHLIEYRQEKIEITTLDRFVEENNIQKIDFIKADIEGAERDMLRGATNVLKNKQPKLAICTYHLPDDPEVLEKIILDANPNYKVVHLRNKLFACVV